MGCFTTGPGGNGGGGSSGFAPTAINSSIGTDSTGIPSVTLTYTSNAFELSSPRVSKADAIRFVATVPGPGELTVDELATVPRRFRGRGRHPGPGTITYATSTETAAMPGGVLFQVGPRKPARRLLHEGASLPIQITVTFTPTGGTPNSQIIHLTVAGTKHK
jgi:hypothetical protein